MPVRDPRRKSRAISISSRKHAERQRCEYSHDQKVFDANKNAKGNGRKPGTPRSQSPANKTKKIDEPCWHWAKGKCRYGDKCQQTPRSSSIQHCSNTEASSSKATPALIHDWSDDEGTFHKVASNVIKKKVRFNESNNTVQTYVKKDFVKCNRKSQTTPKVMVKLVSPLIRLRKR